MVQGPRPPRSVAEALPPPYGPALAAAYTGRGVVRLRSWQDQALDQWHAASASSQYRDGRDDPPPRVALVAAPTAAGKTLVLEALALEAASVTGEHPEGGLVGKAHTGAPRHSSPASTATTRILVALPYTACTEAWRERWEAAALASPTAVVATYESARAALCSSACAAVAAVVVDEIHILGDATRGPGLDALITAAALHPARPRLILASGTLGRAGTADLAAWLTAAVAQGGGPLSQQQQEDSELGSSMSPLPPHTLAAATAAAAATPPPRPRPAAVWTWDAWGQDDAGAQTTASAPSPASTPQSTRHRIRVVPPGAATGTASFVAHVAAVVRDPGAAAGAGPGRGQTLVFVPSRADADAVAAALAPGSAMSHHAGMTRQRRARAVGAFERGTVRTLVATTTLAAGVELCGGRVDRVVVAAPLGSARTAAGLWQMIGRGGRADGAAGETVLVPRSRDEAARAEAWIADGPAGLGLAPPRSAALGEALADVALAVGAVRAEASTEASGRHGSTGGPPLSWRTWRARQEEEKAGAPTESTSPTNQAWASTWTRLCDWGFVRVRVKRRRRRLQGRDARGEASSSLPPAWWTLRLSAAGRAAAATPAAAADVGSACARAQAIARRGVPTTSPVAAVAAVIPDRVARDLVGPRLDWTSVLSGTSLYVGTVGGQGDGDDDWDDDGDDDDADDDSSHARPGPSRPGPRALVATAVACGVPRAWLVAAAAGVSAEGTTPAAAAAARRWWTALCLTALAKAIGDGADNTKPGDSETGESGDTTTTTGPDGSGRSAGPIAAPSAADPDSVAVAVAREFAVTPGALQRAASAASGSCDAMCDVVEAAGWAGVAAAVRAVLPAGRWRVWRDGTAEPVAALMTTTTRDGLRVPYDLAVRLWAAGWRTPAQVEAALDRVGPGGTRALGRLVDRVAAGHVTQSSARTGSASAAAAAASSAAVAAADTPPRRPSPTIHDALLEVGPRRRKTRRPARCVGDDDEVDEIDDGSWDRDDGSDPLGRGRGRRRRGSCASDESVTRVPDSADQDHGPLGRDAAEDAVHTPPSVPRHHSGGGPGAPTGQLRRGVRLTFVASSVPPAFDADARSADVAALRAAEFLAVWVSERGDVDVAVWRRGQGGGAGGETAEAAAEEGRAGAGAGAVTCRTLPPSTRAWRVRRVAAAGTLATALTDPFFLGVVRSGGERRRAAVVWSLGGPEWAAVPLAFREALVFGRGGGGVGPVYDAAVAAWLLDADKAATASTAADGRPPGAADLWSVARRWGGPSTAGPAAAVLGQTYLAALERRLMDGRLGGAARWSYFCRTACPAAVTTATQFRETGLPLDVARARAIAAGDAGGGAAWSAADRRAAKAAVARVTSSSSSSRGPAGPVLVRSRWWSTATDSGGRHRMADPDWAFMPRAVRHAWAWPDAERGLFVGADWREFELRVAAAVSGDPVMAAVCRCEDPFAAVWERMAGAAAAAAGKPGAGGPAAAVGRHGRAAGRRIAKVVVYGAMYGMGVAGVADALDLAAAAAAQWLQAWRLTFAAFVRWQGTVEAAARGRGWVDAPLSGRRTYVDDSGGGGDGASRRAPATTSTATFRGRIARALIQGTASDIANAAVVAVGEVCRRWQFRGARVRVAPALVIADQIAVTVTAVDPAPSRGLVAEAADLVAASLVQAMAEAPRRLAQTVVDEDEVGGGDGAAVAAAAAGGGGPSPAAVARAVVAMDWPVRPGRGRAWSDLDG